METQVIYCGICESAWIETTEKRKDLFYCCIMCRENEQDREIQDNNFEDDKVIEYGN